MKPKTKFQKEIVALSKGLPKITESQNRWAFKNCFEHIGRKTQKGIVSCLECGKDWEDKSLIAGQKVACPHCGTKLTVRETRAYKFQQLEYVCIITQYKGYQVLRFLYCTSNAKKGAIVSYNSTEVVQRWIAPNGQYATMAMLRPMSCFSDSWQWGSGLELRPEKNLYDIMPSQVYPRMGVLADIKRNGFIGGFCNLTPFEMFYTLLTNNKAETLLKAGQCALLKHFVRSSIRNIDTYWNSIRICIRNGYIVEDGSMWCDYIDQLRFFGKDTNNQKYVCPENLHEQHDRYMAKRKTEIDRQRLEEKRKKALKDEGAFKKLKSQFFGIAFTDGTITARVLESVTEFMEEGNAMHHCVFSGAYYLKPNSLVLSATINGNRVETVEVSLDTMKIVQSRGLQNSPTAYHKQIVDLMNKNMYQIKQRYKQIG